MHQPRRRVEVRPWTVAWRAGPLTRTAPRTQSKGAVYRNQGANLILGAVVTRLLSGDPDDGASRPPSSGRRSGVGAAGLAENLDPKRVSGLDYSEGLGFRKRITACQSNVMVA